MVHTSTKGKSGGHIKKKHKSGRKETKATRRARGFDFKSIKGSSNLHDVMYEMQPFIELMVGPFEESMYKNFSWSKHNLSFREIWIAVCQAVEGTIPADDFLAELIDGGLYHVAREAVNARARGLKDRFNEKILAMHREVLTEHSIEVGQAINKDTIYVAVEEPTAVASYGTNNRKASTTAGKAFQLPSLEQHLHAWSELTPSTNNRSGETESKPYIGGHVLDNFIIKLKAAFGSEPRLEFLCMMLAYIMAKDNGISVNHGFDLELAAQELGKWYETVLRSHTLCTAHRVHITRTPCTP